jgi:hypothetical protein
MLRGGLEAGTLAAAAVGVGAGAGFQALHRPLHPDALDVSAPEIPALHGVRLWHPRRTDGRWQALIGALATILASPPGLAFYYTIEGRLASVPLPEEGTPTLAWHHDNRVRLAAELGVVQPVHPLSPADFGYPIVTLSPSTASGKPLLEELDQRLATSHTSAHLGGATRTLWEGISRAAREAGAPAGLALGVAALESRLQSATSGGLYRLDAGAGLDPFAQTARFAAHLRSLQQAVRPALESLSARLAALTKTPDPLQGVDLTPLATLSALHGGAALVDAMVADLIALPDATLEARLGPSPHGLDVWLAVLTGALGQHIDRTALLYPIKALAWSWLMSSHDDALPDTLRLRPSITTERGLSPRAERRRACAGAALSAGGVLGGLLTIGGLTGGLLTRRGLLLRGLPTALAAGVIGAGPGREVLQETRRRHAEPEPVDAPIDEAPPPSLLGCGEVPAALCADLEAILAEARGPLGGLLRQLRYRGSDAALPVEEVIRIRYRMDEQTALLTGELESWFGEDFVRRFLASSRRRITRVRKLFEEGAELQTAALAQRLQSGVLIPMEPDSPGLPYFCQQVGENSGLDNHPDALFMHRDFLLVLHALRALVNHQIGLFNADSERLGYADFPRIPWISAVKVSGAFRPMMQFYELNRKHPGRTTRQLSAHTIGHALDIGSLAPMLPGAGVVRLAGDMRDREGEVHVRSGELLPTMGFGVQTRGILSRMIGRALMGMAEPMERRLGVLLCPLWEAQQQNWHVILAPRAPAPPPG